MKILSFNIRHGGGSRCEKIIKSISQHNANTIVLTEFRNNKNAIIFHEGLSNQGYKYYAHSCIEEKNNSVAIFSKESFVPSVFPLELENDSQRAILAKFSDISILGVYFAQNNKKASLFDFLNQRSQQILGDRGLVIGDFNTGKFYLDEAKNTFYCVEHFESLEQNGLIDSWRAASDEVQLTQSIQDKAAELDHDAVKIYHWVRNNIEWLPSWGAIQDAELTLEARRGNAMDIASLTLSLLRASKIPARYVHGTIDVPVEKYKNWVGGFTSYEAAGNYASSAGIPTTGIATGGQVTKIRMEHVWVEAATDFHPSRGAKNKEADTWVQLDPSYKQYEYQQGLDVVAISGLDIEQLAQDFVNSGTTNQAQGWATGFDPAILQQAQAQAQAAAQTKLEAHIATLDNPTVGDVIGGKKTIIKEYPTLPSSLPNNIKVVGTRYDKLPDALQQKIEFAFQKDILGDLIDPITYPFAKLNNEKVTLSFKPATQADEEALKSLVPDNITDTNQLPKSIPSYLISVVPQIEVGGDVVKMGTPMLLGEELELVTGIRLANRGYAVAPRSYNVVAGSYLNLNVFAGSVSPVKLKKHQAKMEDTQNIINSADQIQLSQLTHDNIFGDIFYAGGLAYYGLLEYISETIGLRVGGYGNLVAGYGTFGYETRVNHFFGFPRSISTGAIVFDIPVINTSAVQDGNVKQKIEFVKQTGAIGSALEHIVPEFMFDSDDPNIEKPDAISAIKALQKANATGQRIYHITQANQSLVLPLLNHGNEVMSNVRASLAVGKEITIHTDPITIPGWTGSGYTVIDPDTGSGAYLISGGQNGGFLVAFIVTVLVFLAVYALIVSGFFLAAGALFAWEFFNLIGWIRNINKADNFNDFNKANASQALVGALGLLLAPGIGIKAAATLIFGVGFSWILTNI